MLNVDAGEAEEVQLERRVLSSKDNRIDDLLKNITEIENLLTGMDNMLKYAKNRSGDFSNVYDEALKNLTELFNKSYQLLELQGRFYEMTNRIWVTSQNIYQLFKRRATTIEDEIQKIHFVKEANEENYRKIELLEENYKIIKRIEDVEPIELVNDEPIDLRCSLTYAIDND